MGMESMKVKKINAKPKPRGYWSVEKIKKESSKYKTRTEFLSKAPKAYDAARRFSILKEVTSHMRLQREEWDKGKIYKAARQCTTRQEFSTKYPGAKHAAKRTGILEDVCKHMPIYRKKCFKEYSEERKEKRLSVVREMALKYSRRGDFSKGASGAYQTARNLGILDEVCKHMVKLKKLSKN